MRGSLMIKLIAAFLGVSLVAVALVALIGYLVATNEFDRFISQEAEANFALFVSDYYKVNGDLNGIDEALRARFENHSPDDAAFPRLAPFGLADAEGIVRLRSGGYVVGARAPAELLAGGTRILVNGRWIGVVLPRSDPPPRNRAQQQYLERTGIVLALAAVGAALFAIGLGAFLARRIVTPLRALTQAAQQMAKGALSQTVRVQSRDEVGALALAFNQMSADLERSDQQRRQMTADIAHELRNPLTVIGGYLDAMRAGDLQPTPTRLAAVYDEIQHLEKIVEDLRTLSLADADALVLNRQPLAAQGWLTRVAARFAPQAAQRQITLRVANDAAALTIDVDELRLTQALDNLVSNALQHSTEGGSITLRAMEVNGRARIAVADTGTGIASDDLPRVFERFYRGDKARPAEQGSSGLGLAIAKALVNAHGGKIWAESELGRGATFTLELPLAQT